MNGIAPPRPSAIPPSCVAVEARAGGQASADRRQTAGRPLVALYTLPQFNQQHRDEVS
jgi:hypothetical protein